MSHTITSTSRYIRQEILGQFRDDGQLRLAEAHVGLVGAGALGSTIADLLVRAGIGTLTLIDRDYVELHNLQRQSLYCEGDVHSHLPKAAAAAERLAEINRSVTVNPIVADVNSVNIEALLADCTILVDGTDNFETRYLLNDLAVKSGRPWVYGGVIATYGMTTTIIPKETACLRCVFPDTPDAGSTPTCETAGVLGPAVHVIAALQASEVIKLALGHADRVNRHLVSLDIWNMEMTRVPTGGPRSGCPTCQERRFDFLDRATPNLETSLCGHDAVQVMVQPPVKLDLEALGHRLRPIGDVLLNRFLVRFTDPATGHELTVFPDGRAIIKGVTEPAVARAVYDRYVGFLTAMIYLDNAATSWPKPESVRAALLEALDHYGANPGRASHQMAIRTSEMIYRTRLGLARLINAESPERIVFCTNATDALNVAIFGLLKPGDKAVTSSMEHNSVRRPLRRMRDLGVDVVTVQAERIGVIDPDAIRAVAAGARLIVITHASNVNGAVQPIQEIAKIAHDCGALLLVDGAQTIGAMPIYVRELGIDLLAFPGHKSLLGPSGTGGLYISPNVDVADMTPLHAGGTGLRSEDDTEPLDLPYRYESGTVNTLGIAGLEAGIKHVVDIGVDVIAMRHQATRLRLISGLWDTGVRVFGPGQEDAADVISFEIDGWQPADVGAVLDQSFAIACRTGLHCAPTACATIGAGPNGTIRLSPGLTTTNAEIDAAISAVAEITATSMAMAGSGS